MTPMGGTGRTTGGPKGGGPAGGPNHTCAWAGRAVKSKAAAPTKGNYTLVLSASNGTLPTAYQKFTLVIA